MAAVARGPRRGRHVERVVRLVGRRWWSTAGRSTTSTPRATQFEAAFRRSVAGAGRTAGCRTTSRCCGRSPSSGSPSGSPTHPSTSTTSAAATGPSTSTRRCGCDHWCGRVRQVLLHRPDPRAVRARRRTCARSSAAPSRSADPASARPTFRKLLALAARQRSRGSASATRSSAASPPGWRADRADRAGQRGARARWSPRSAGRPPTRPPADLLTAAVRPLRPGSLCARRSPGLTCRGRRVGLYGAGPRGRRRTCAPAGPAGSSRCWSTTRDRRLRRPAVLPTADGGLDALLGCDVVIKTPGISPLRRRRSRSWSARASRSSAASASGSQDADPQPRRLHHRHQGQEHDDRDRRPPADRAGLPLPGRRQHRRAAVRPGRRRGRRLLGRRGVELPGDRPAPSRPRSSR